MDRPVEEMIAQADALLAHPNEHVRGRRTNEHVVLDIVGEAVHYWSPQLQLRVEPDPDEPTQTIVHGLIGPRPPVWTLFVFIYFTIGVVGFFVASYGFVLRSLGKPSLLVYALPIGLVLLLTAYGTSKFGERLATEQTNWLKDVVRKLVQE